MSSPRPRGLTTMRIVMLYTLVMGNLNGSKGVNGTPIYTYAYINSVPDQHSIYPGGQHTRAFYTKYVMPNGQGSAVLR